MLVSVNDKLRKEEMREISDKVLSWRMKQIIKNKSRKPCKRSSFTYPVCAKRIATASRYAATEGTR